MIGLCGERLKDREATALLQRLNGQIRRRQAEQEATEKVEAAGAVFFQVAADLAAERKPPAAGVKRPPRPDFIREVQDLLGGPSRCGRPAVLRFVGRYRPEQLLHVARLAAKYGTRNPVGFFVAALTRGKW